MLLSSVAGSPLIAVILNGSRSPDAGDFVRGVTGGNRRVRSVTFASAEEKANWLDAMATLDARLPLVREVARRFATARYADPNDLESIVKDFHRFCRDGIRYVKDPAAEELSDAEQTIRQGYGDCDDKSRLFVALCRSIQAKARIRPCFDREDFVHVQAEVIPEFWTGAGWKVAELIVRDLPLGELPRKGVQVLQ